MKQEVFYENQQMIGIGISVLLVVIGIVFSVLRTTKSSKSSKKSQKDSKKKSTKKVWISIEGIIGVGKSTFIGAILPHIEKRYQETHRVVVVPEPVEQWIESGHLALSTQEPYVAQTYFFHTRVEAFLNVIEKNEDSEKPLLILSERSPFTDCKVFWKTTCDNGLATELAARTYPLLWNTWMRLLTNNIPDLFVDLTLEIDQAQERIKERARVEEETTVTPEYQEQLQKAHSALFDTESGMVIVNERDNIQVPSIKLSASENFRDDPTIAKTLAQQLCTEIDKILV